eukprot:scaffold1243_cov403-Prasinococcus_capsulatus_cf.AAC.9
MYAGDVAMPSGYTSFVAAPERPYLHLPEPCSRATEPYKTGPSELAPSLRGPGPAPSGRLLPVQRAHARAPNDDDVVRRPLTPCDRRNRSC